MSPFQAMYVPSVSETLKESAMLAMELVDAGVEVTRNEALAAIATGQGIGMLMKKSQDFERRGTYGFFDEAELAYEGEIVVVHTNADQLISRKMASEMGWQVEHLENGLLVLAVAALASIPA